MPVLPDLRGLEIFQVFYLWVSFDFKSDYETLIFFVDFTCRLVVAMSLSSSRTLSLALKCSDFLRSCGARFFCDNPTARLSPNTAITSFGVLLDIDGVLVRGRKPIPGAREALEMLRQSEVPTVFLTNGGCESEQEAAEHLSDKIGFEVILCLFL